MKAVGSEKIWFDGNWQDGYLLYDQGKVVGFDRSPVGCDSQDIEEYPYDCIIPGVVDTHVHINEPGRTEWEGYDTATKAAAAGGITTVADMPLNCIPVTTTQDALQQKLQALAGKLSVDCAFHGGVVPGNASELQPMFESGVKSFKAFMIDSGIEEFPHCGEEDLRIAMVELQKVGATLLVHAEVDTGTDVELKDPRSYQEFLRSRPDEWEKTAIDQIIALGAETGCAVHIVHLSSASCLESIVAARKRGQAVTVETCPHYLCLAAESIPDGDARYKCCPPIRTNHNQEELWKGLRSGDIDFVVSDHSPCTPALKRLEEKNLRDAWGGISSLQFGLSLMWQAFAERGFELEDLVKVMCEEPAKLIQRHDQKGKLRKGFDADFVVLDPAKSTTIRKEEILHRHKETPYLGFEGLGEVRATYLRGQKIYADKKIRLTGTGVCLL